MKASNNKASLLDKALKFLSRKKSLQSIESSRGWIPVLQESFLGAFQTDDPVSLNNALTHPTVFSCVTQIAFDIGKLRLNITQKTKDGISIPVNVPRFSRVIDRPNPYQVTQQFIEYWCISLLTYGNTYILKQRDATGHVIGLYILDPNKVWPLISDTGDIFYRLQRDSISNLTRDIDAAPAYEIIHDRMACLFHPLIGVPPLYAADLATLQGLYIQKHSAKFFGNNAQPSGILTAPGHIKQPTAERLKADWKEKYTGDNSGNVAVLGDGLSYTPITSTAVDSALIEQLGWSDEKICSTFKVPPYKIHVGRMPTYQQSETLDRAYYSGCLQRIIESIERLLGDGMGIIPKYSMEFNLDDLMRMDLSMKMKTNAEGVKGGIVAPNEARRKFNLIPVRGGETPYLQQQNYSLAALDERDRNDPFKKAEPKQNNEPEIDETDKGLSLLYRKDIPGVYRD